MALGELTDHRDDRGGLGLVAFVAADLQREPASVDQETDHDLRIDTAFLGEADLAQLVLVLGLEVERRHVVQAQRDVSAAQGMSEAGRGDRAAVVALLSTLQRAEHRAKRDVSDPEIAQHPDRVGLRGRLYQSSQDELLERLISNDVEPEVGVRVLEHVPQDGTGLARDHARTRHAAHVGLGEESQRLLPRS